MIVSFLLSVWDVMLELSPWLLLGAAVAGLMHGLLPAGFIHRQFSGRTGVLKAVSLGVPLPLCSCAVIPAGLGLKKDGASDGAAIGFITATPQTGVDSILVSASFLGWPFALSKVVAALFTGASGGFLADAVGGTSTSPKEVESEHTHGRDWRGMLEHGIDLIRVIWGWLLFGILLSAAITTFLPEDTFAGLSGAGIGLAFGAVLGISLPLYVCATASVPIAASLVAAGMPTGAAMVFLMAGPATNVATLGAVYRAFGSRILAVYLINIIIGSAAFGLGYEALFGDVVVGTMSAHEHSAWWMLLGAVILSGMLLWFAAEDLRSFISRRKALAASNSVDIMVKGMTCGGCASRLERVLLATDGVTSASVSIEDHRAIVVGLSVESVSEVIDKAGFKAVR
jgi:hypothetical protein